MGYEMFEFKAKEVILDYNMKNENKTCTTESFLSVGRTNSFESGAFALDESVQYGVFTVAKISKAHIVDIMCGLDFKCTATTTTNFSIIFFLFSFVYIVLMLSYNHILMYIQQSFNFLA